MGGHAFVPPLSMAGLLDCNANVLVYPPLFASPETFTSRTLLVLVDAVKVGVASELMLFPASVIVS